MMTTSPNRYDAVVVGGSLAGCTAAILLGREGLRVAVVEKQPDPAAFKRICSHFIQAGSVPTVERLGLLEPIEEAGGVRSRIRAWTPMGWVVAPPDKAGLCLNIRREKLDPMVREAAASTPGVDLFLGRSAVALTKSDGAFDGVTIRDSEGNEETLVAKLVIGADGRDSKVAKLSEVDEKTHPHGRFAYGTYFEGAAPEGAPDGTIWMTDPQWAAAFPTDEGLTFYAVMPTMDHLPEFKRDAEGAMIAFLANLPEPPPIHEGRRVDDVIGKIDMTNRVRGPVAPGLALIGDAALATDPLFGVGCGWAFQSGEWLSDSVTPALRGEEALDRGLKRYRKTHRRTLGAHAYLIHDQANGRKFDSRERMLFKAAARDPKVAAIVDEMATRRSHPVSVLARAVPRAIVVNARDSISRSGLPEHAPGGRVEAAAG
jgi:2-polyprenyl-6-methoxyphenol hydroxylase-like FAD-dependent oxidoreductase